MPDDVAPAVALTILFGQKPIKNQLLSICNFASDRMAKICLRDELLVACGLSSAELESSILLEGTPGPNKKIAAITISAGGQPRFVTKFGAGENVAALLQNEAAALAGLNHAQSLQKHVPTLCRLHANGAFTSLKQSAAVRVGVVRPAEALQYQLMLSEATSHWGNWSSSKIISEIEANSRRVEKGGCHEWVTRASLVMSKMVRSDTAWRFGIAHRDFAPWNLMNTEHGTYAFDWEYSRNGFPVGYDYCHFVLAGAALSGKRISLATLKMGLRAYPDVLILSYMTDLCLLYLASGPEGVRSPIVSAYGLLIDQLLRGRG